MYNLCSFCVLCVCVCSLCKVYVIKVFIWLWGFRRAVQRSFRLDLLCVRGEWEITSAVRRGKVKNNLSSLLSLSFSLSHPLLPGCPPSHLWNVPSLALTRPSKTHWLIFSLFILSCSLIACCSVLCLTLCLLCGGLLTAKLRSKHKSNSSCDQAPCYELSGHRGRFVRRSLKSAPFSQAALACSERRL